MIFFDVLHTNYKDVSILNFLSFLNTLYNVEALIAILLVSTYLPNSASIGSWCAPLRSNICVPEVCETINCFIIFYTNKNNLVLAYVVLLSYIFNEWGKKSR